jgi:hypothetical protein
MINKNEKSINDLQVENAKLKNEINIRDKLKLEEGVKEILDTTYKTIVRLGSHANTMGNRSDNVTPKIDNILRKLNATPTIKPLKKYYEYEEWWSDALKQNNLSMNEYNKYKSNPLNTRIVDLIEFLNSIIVDKNFQIKIIEDENYKLNQINDVLNRQVALKSKKINDSLENNLSSNSIIFKQKNYFEYKKCNTLSSVTSSEFREGINEVRILSNLNESICIDNINININEL